MLFFKELKLMESVNIFTDVSTSPIDLAEKSKSISVNSIGMLVSYNSTIPCQSIKILIDEHNVFGEIKAIELAVMWCIAHSNPTFPFYYNIFTDSQTSVQAINGYLSNYYVNQSNFTRKKIYNLLDANDNNKTNFDNVAKIIAYLLITNRLPIRVIYTPAHIDLEKNKDGELKRAINKFYSNNKYFRFSININEMYLILSGNHAIDYLTRAYLLNNLEYIKKDIKKSENYIQYGIKRDIPLVWPYSFYEQESFFIAGYEVKKYPYLSFEDIMPITPFTIPQLQIC